jgi:DNA-binding CsgD family transcriptional regulator
MSHRPEVANPGDSDAKTVRSLQALKLRTQGMSYAAIGQALGINHQTAYTDVQYALAETKAAINSAALDFIALELERLDRLQEAAWQKTMPDESTGKKFNVTAGYLVLAIIDKRMKLLGLEPAQNLNITASAAPEESGALTDRQRQERIAAILAAAKNRLLAAPEQITIIEQALAPEDSHTIDRDKTAK